MAQGRRVKRQQSADQQPAAYDAPAAAAPRRAPPLPPLPDLRPPAPAPAPAPAPEKAVAPGGAAAKLQAEIAELLQAQDEMKSLRMRKLLHHEIEVKQRELAELTRAAKSQAPGMQMPPDVTFQAFGHIKEVFDFFANTAEEHRGFCPMLDADTESTITANKKVTERNNCSKKI